jgi:ribosome maturation factor RimP
MDLEKIKKIIEPVVTECGYELYDIEFEKEFGEDTLTVLVDSKTGKMDVQMIIEVSHKINDFMDLNENLIPGQYNLNVSSVGPERKLRTENELDDAIGKHVFIEFNDKVEGMATVQGDLKGKESDEFELVYRDKTRNKTIKFNYENVKNARIAIKF